MRYHVAWRWYMLINKLHPNTNVCVMHDIIVFKLFYIFRHLMLQSNAIMLYRTGNQCRSDQLHQNDTWSHSPVTRATFSHGWWRKTLWQCRWWAIFHAFLYCVIWHRKKSRGTNTSHTIWQLCLRLTIHAFFEEKSVRCYCKQTFLLLHNFNWYKSLNHYCLVQTAAYRLQEVQCTTIIFLN